MIGQLKSLIKKVLPKTLIDLIAKQSKVSTDYKILNNPDLDKLKNKYQNAWQNNSLPTKQLKIVKKKLPDFTNVAPIKSLIELLKKIETENKTILEIGCSSGYYSEILTKAGFNLKYEGCDYSPEFIKLAKERYPSLNFKICDATKLNYDNNQFDIVISGCCLLHIINYEQAIKETSRVAKNFVIFHRTPILHQTKTTFAEKTAYGVKMVEIFFNENEFKELIKKYGLEILNFDTHDEMNINKLNEPVLMKSYLCKKQ